MKDVTLHTLMTARVLLEQAEQQCAIGDRHLATAGLIVLQDAMELVFLAALLEIGVDERASLEKFTFDEMVAELARVGAPVPKSGTLKAMNKLRVAAKHYGQLMEPQTVLGHLKAAKVAADSVLLAIIGKPLGEVFLTELVSEGDARSHMEEAVVAFRAEDFLECLIAVRKAVFLEFEQEYCIWSFRDSDAEGMMGLLGIMRGGWKAPYWTKKKSWILQNVKVPADYVQIDHDTLRMDALEWGINTQSLHNLRRLTPSAVQFGWRGTWHVQYSAAFPTNSANADNARYCIDLAIEVIRRKEEHSKRSRFAASDKPTGDYPPAYVGQPMFIRPDLGLLPIRHLTENETYLVKEVLTGFDAEVTFYRIQSTDAQNQTHDGFVQKLTGEPPLENAVDDVGKAAEIPDQLPLQKD